MDRRNNVLGERMGTIKLVSHSQAAELSAAKKELLDKRLRGVLKTVAKSTAAIPVRNSDAPAPLSFSQERLWFIHQMEPESCAYNVPCALRIVGDLNAPALEAAVNALIERHGVLRTTIHARDGKPVQVIQPTVPTALPVVDLQEYGSHEREAHLEQLVHREVQRPFNLEAGPLIRCVLFRLNEREHLFLIVKHHVISDGWSLGVFFKELEHLYHAFVNEQRPELPPLPIQYADFSAWQQQQTEAKAFEDDVRFWKEKLDGAPAMVDLPTDRARPARPGFRGGHFTLMFPETFYEGMIGLNQDLGTTIFMLLMAGLSMVLSKWCRQPEMVLGTVVACRTRREIEHLIGCFMNFVPVRVTFTGVQTGLDLLKQIKASIVEAHSHQDCPFEKIVEAVHPTRGFTKNPLYNVALLLQNFPAGLLRGDGIRSSFVPVHTDTSLLDMRFVAQETDKKLAITCEYDADLFEPGTIHYLMRSYLTVLEQLVKAPHTALSEFSIADQLREQGDVARRRSAKEALTIASSFTAEPLEPTLKFWLKELELSGMASFAPYQQVFQQLLDPASAMAQNQRGANIILLRLNDFQNTDLQQVVSELIAAVKAAATRTAVPLMLFICPPPKSIRRMFSDAEKGVASELASVPNVYVNTSDELLSLYPVDDYDDPATDALGHMPYTPPMYAAIGTLIARKYHLLKRPPKKVVVLDCDNTLWSGICAEDGPQAVRCDAARQAFQRFIRAQHQAGTLLSVCSKNNEEDVDAVFAQCTEMVLQKGDFAAWRVNWRPKSENLRSLADELRLALDSFVFIDDNPMEVAEVEANCPEVLALQLPEDCSSLPHWLKHLWVFDHAKLTIEDKNRAAQYQQNRMREQLLAESMSMADFMARLNLQVRIQQAQTGQIPRLSQLTLRTNQFNTTTKRRSEAELTQMCSDPIYKLFSVSVSDRFGDYGLVGLMVCELRHDALVADSFMLSCRVLGKGVEHRMLAELGQCAQAAGLRHVEVPFSATARNTPVLEFLNSVGSSFRQGYNGSTMFHFPADVAARTIFDPQTAESRRPAPSPLAASTPSEELPGARFRRFNWIAQCANNAADILKLVEGKSAPITTGLGAMHQPPSSELEKQLCTVWKELLRRESVSVGDDFFVLGGTSLLAVRLCAQLEKTLGHKVSLATLFKSPTVEQLARAIERKQARPSRSAVVAIQPKGDRPPLMLVHGAGGGILWGYSNLAAHLGTDQPLYGFEPHAFNVDRPVTVEEMAVRYTKDLCAFQSKGPYYLGGYCFGGYVAYEMARYLESRGEQVALLLLIDSAAPNSGYERVTWWQPAFYPRFALNSAYWLFDFARLDAREARDLIRRKWGAAKRKAKVLFGDKSSAPAGFTLEEFIDTTQFPEHELELWRLHLTAGTNYVPKPYGGRVHLLRTRGQPFFCSFDPQYGWGRLALGRLEVRIVPGAHEQIFMEPNVRILAAQVSAALAASQNQKFGVPPSGGFRESPE
jgi:FkbH-like protein